MGLMRNRRFLLATLLAALAVALWLAPAGLALRHAVVKQVFSGKLVRLEAIERTAVAGSADWRIDRGVVASASGSMLTLREADGRVQTIPLASSTRVLRLGRRVSLGALKQGRRVLVTWPASGPAQSVDVERVPKVGSKRLGH